MYVQHNLQGSCRLVTVSSICQLVPRTLERTILSAVQRGQYQIFRWPYPSRHLPPGAARGCVTKREFPDVPLERIKTP